MKKKELVVKKDGPKSSLQCVNSVGKLNSRQPNNPLKRSRSELIPKQIQSRTPNSTVDTFLNHKFRFEVFLFFGAGL